jgi:hypothetical protein
VEAERPSTRAELTELEEVYENADKNYQQSLKLLGDSVLLVQDFVDIYERITRITAGSPLALHDENLLSTQFLMASRYYLTVGITDCMRCHLTDTFAKTRMAIENAAFAARVQRHPHLAKTWVEAGQGEDEYEDYRDKFKKLFPADNQLLKVLGERYDFCAKQTHPSIYSFAGRSKVETSETVHTFELEYFQGEKDGSEPVRTFFWTVNTHMLITNVYREVFAKALAHDAKALELRANSVEAKYFTEVCVWVSRIPALRPLAGA